MVTLKSSSWWNLDYYLILLPIFRIMSWSLSHPQWWAMSFCLFVGSSLSFGFGFGFDLRNVMNYRKFVYLIYFNQSQSLFILFNVRPVWAPLNWSACPFEMNTLVFGSYLAFGHSKTSQAQLVPYLSQTWNKEFFPRIFCSF